MKLLTVLFLILILSLSAQAQFFKGFDESNFLVYTNQILIGESQTGIAVGIPLIRDNLYYGFYLSRIPGLRLEYKFYDYLITGFSLLDNKNIYHFQFHYGIKIARHLRISAIFTDREAGLEFVFSYR